MGCTLLPKSHLGSGVDELLSLKCPPEQDSSRVPSLRYTFFFICLMQSVQDGQQWERDKNDINNSNSDNNSNVSSNSKTREKKFIGRGSIVVVVVAEEEVTISPLYPHCILTLS